MIDLKLKFRGELWVYDGPGAWYFITLPVDIAEQIKFFREKHLGFGTVRVKVCIGETEWKTSLFPDKASNSFLLPIKADIRKKENLTVGETVFVKFEIDL